MGVWMKKQQQFQTNAMSSGLNFRIMELPDHVVCDILSRPPLKTIVSCKSVCKLFFKLVTDPYFAKIHLTNSSTTTAGLVIRERSNFYGMFYIYMLNLDETTSASCTTDDPCHCFHPNHALTITNAELCFSNAGQTVVGSCNGLLCLYSNSSRESSYYICNPILGEFMAVPSPTLSTKFYNYLDHSGFGFCPRTKQYKVIRFMRMTFFDQTSSKTVAEIHTLGTETWRKIMDAPCPKVKGSIDSLLNGALHWITDSRSTSDLIYSFDLEMEKFRPVPPPDHFDSEYTSKISWINVGALGGCLCICYVFSDSQYEVWVMKDYGVKESWIKEFVIDMKFYCGLRGEDLHQPIRFLNSGDLWLICGSKSLVIYSPQKGTFRDFKALEFKKAEVIAHIPSFISLKDSVIGESRQKVQSVKWQSYCCFRI